MIRLIFILLFDVVIGTLAGYLASMLMKIDSSNMVQNCCLGILGGIVGTFLGRLIGLAATGWFGDLLFSVAGAVVVIYVYQKFIRK